ncbi:MAG TPA: acyl-CoA thioesterase domain-containing protein [Candidatus Binatia bacterium]|nr:acyl-CoA thioesterase domain-containing protein [Candidatus Binatia bacterium]
MSDTSTAPLSRLLHRLNLEQLDRDLFIGRSGRGEGALFGGMVAAQAAIAAGRTVSERHLHSLHGYFLRPGQHRVPIRFVVDRIRDGRTFATRSVVAHQAGEAIFNLSASFTKSEPGVEHQEPMPSDAPAPDGLLDWEDLRAHLLGDPAQRRPDGPVEVRVCDPDSPDPTVKLPARRRVWMRPRGRLPDDPLLHAAMLVFASDRTLLRTAGRPHGLTWKLRMGASLDHTVWLHRAPRFDDWVLFDCVSPVAHGARALITAAMYRRDGVRIASVAQEGLLRV